LAAAVAETQSARERIEALESEKAAAEPVLASVRAEAEESLVRVQALEAEKAAWEHPAFALTEELLKEREAALTAASGETQAARERIEAL
jgi:hypothetical protein